MSRTAGGGFATRRAALLAAAVIAAITGAAGCEREARLYALSAELSDTPSAPATTSPFADNAWATAEGKTLYVQMNCNGCHAMGGGGMGPPLMDGGWRYGSDPATVFTSIVEGRPNGMPSFKDRISEEQAWKLVEYVRSMPALTPYLQRPSRADDMHVKTPEVQETFQPPRPEAP